MYIYPSPGLRVRDPVKRDVLPAEGREVPDGDIYWMRRLTCGDATLEAPKQAPAASSAAKVDKTTVTDGSAAQ